MTDKLKEILFKTELNFYQSQVICDVCGKNIAEIDDFVAIVDPRCKNYIFRCKQCQKDIDNVVKIL